MNFLLDTCVISELIKRKPSEKVTNWFSGKDEENLFISVLTLGEIRKGIEKLRESKRKEALYNWLTNNLKERFWNRIIDIDMQVAMTWGKIQGISERVGQPMPAIDSLIAATGIAYNLTVITRNISDMNASGAMLLNPWI